MKAALKFLKAQKFTLLLLIVSLLIAYWIINTQRAPGSMTLIEAQSMDMTTMRPPEGVQPVAIEHPTKRMLARVVEYPATFIAFSDEEITARIPGRLAHLYVYSGDRVRAGQLLGKLEANEITAQFNESNLMATSKLATARAATQEIGDRQSQFVITQANARLAEATFQGALADYEATKAEHQRTKEELSTTKADLSEQEAALFYENQNLQREQFLYKSGAISLDELQISIKQRDIALAKVKAAQARVRTSQRNMTTAEKKVKAAWENAEGAKARIAAAKAEITQAKINISKAKQTAKAAQLDAKSAKAASKGKETLAGYEELRTLLNGIVSERIVSPGTAVTVGQVILKIKEMDPIRIQSELPQNLFPFIKIGDSVKVIINSMQYMAAIKSIFPSASEQTRTFRIETTLPNKDMNLLPGTYARMQVSIGHKKLALAVRNSAIQSTPNGSHYVWVIVQQRGKVVTDWTCSMHPQISDKGPGKCPICGMDLVPRKAGGKFVAEKRIVQTGVSDGSYTEIISGLQEGDKVIWAGFENLQPGTPVISTKWGISGPKQLPSGREEMNMKNMPGMSHSRTTNPSRE